MIKRNEHLVVIMLEPAPPGQEFIEWPLHITVVPWFPSDDDQKLNEILEAVAAKHQPFKLKVGSLAKFGAKKPLAVNILTNEHELYMLHWDVFRTLEKNGFHIHQKAHLGQNYRGHITHQPHGHKNEGQELRINRFTLVKQIRLKKTGTMVKSVAKDYKLG